MAHQKKITMIKINNQILTIIFTAYIIIAFNFIKIDAFAQAVDSSSEKDMEQFQANIQNIPSDTANSDVAILQGLNKITAKTSALKVKVGEKTNFGSLSIEVKKCWKSPPDQNPENKILLKISEVDGDGLDNVIFYGWMFSSSPSISGLEHPIYDIIAISCKFK